MSTKFDAEAIKKSAENIGGIMSDMSAFEALKQHWPNAGKFEVAGWLERIVDDRRNAIVAHGEHLRLAFEKMKEKLNSIATDFQDLDGENADKVKASIAELEGQVIEAVNAFDTETEEAQHNYSDDTTENNTNDPGDGDGYNDNLTTT